MKTSSSMDDKTDSLLEEQRQTNLSDSSSQSGEELDTSDSEEEEYDEEVDPYMGLDDDVLSVATSIHMHIEDDLAGIESALGSRKIGEVAVDKLAIESLQDLDCRSPFAKQARTAGDSVAPQHDEDIQTLTSSVRKMRITPLSKRSETFSVYVSDEELLRQVEDWEANGLLYQTSVEQLRDEDILQAMNEYEASLSLVYIPITPVAGQEQSGTNKLLHESLQVTIEGISDKRSLYSTHQIASTSDSVAVAVTSSDASMQIVDGMDVEGVADDVLFKAMEEWENTQIHAAAATQNNVGEIVTISQEVSLLAHGLTSSSISPDQGVVKTDGKMFSPYITPFTSSKIMSAGKYLYLPSKDNHVDYMVCGSSEVCDDLAQLSILDSLDKRNIDAVLNRVQVAVLTDICTVQTFLADLKKSNVLVFELVFRPLPRHLLHAYTQPNKLKDGLQSWSSYISTVVSPIFNITSNISDFSLASSLQHYNVNSREALQGCYVLTGISFYVGGMEKLESAFYLPLPCLLPIPKFSLSVQHTPSSLDMLPMRCKQLVVSYCGFENLISKSSGVYAFYRASIRTTSRVCSNPLFAVSRNWCLVARYTAVLCWRLGLIGLEWRFLQELFANPSILKVSAHIRMKMAALREREVTLFGSVYDPSIAHELLATMQETSTLYVPSLNKHQYAGLNDRQRSVHLASSRCIVTAYCLSSLTKILCEHKLWDIFHKIEMPLLLCVADMELNGIEVDTNSLSALRKDLVERKKVIEDYFTSIYGKDFSLESGADTKKVRDLVLKQYRQLFEATYGAGKGPQLVSISGRSDWSIGKASGNAAQLMDSQIVAQAREHILWQLMSEYHSHAKVLPNLSSMLSNRKFQRVRPSYSTIGTETGRIIANQPPIQQVKLYIHCLFCSALNAFIVL
ncbi:hypothetical protein EON65_26255 [archaeon]|nr:MAG: hypothetical protein EON65_26255 [archaeon]